MVAYLLTTELYLCYRALLGPGEHPQGHDLVLFTVGNSPHILQEIPRGFGIITNEIITMVTTTMVTITMVTI